MHLFLIGLILLSYTVTPQKRKIQCLNANNRAVAWSVSLSVPQSRYNKGYPGHNYYDSLSDSVTFDYIKGQPDSPDTPHYNTVSQIAQYKLKTVAWNDQLTENQGLGNSNKAHAKFFLAFDSTSKTGFAIVHSLPEYPSIGESGFIQPPIQAKQRVKAQHLLCISLNSQDQANQLLDNSCLITPNIYINTLNGKNCPKVGASDDKFRYTDRLVGKNRLQAIFKNGNSGQLIDIFSEGVAPLIQSDIITQTFGSPKPTAPDCDSKFRVGNSQQIVINAKVRWNQGSDHSKWIYALGNDYSCFGDLNRNTDAQLKRGGSFYCIQNHGLNQALRDINPQPDFCEDTRTGDVGEDDQRVQKQKEEI